MFLEQRQGNDSNPQSVAQGPPDYLDCLKCALALTRRVPMYFSVIARFLTATGSPSIITSNVDLSPLMKTESSGPGISPGGAASPPSLFQLFPSVQFPGAVATQ